MKLLLAAFLIIATPVWAQALGDRGEAGLGFMTIPVSARAVALSNAMTAAAADVAALDTNPASLSGLRTGALQVTHISYFEDTALDAFTLGFPLDTAAEIPKWTTALQYRLFHADDERRADNGFKLGDFDIREQFIQMGLAYRPAQWSYGGSFKYLRSELDDEQLSGWAFDAGLTWLPQAPWTLGASLMNWGSSQSYIEEDTDLPSSLNCGGTWAWQKLLFLASFSESKDGFFTGAGGVEWKIHPVLNLRGGFQASPVVEFSGGMGLNLPTINLNPQYLDFVLDYGLKHHMDLGMTHTISLRIYY